MACLALHICSALGAKAKGGGPLTLKHFIEEKKGKRVRASTTESMIRFAELATAMMGGKDLRKHGKDNAG